MSQNIPKKNITKLHASKDTVGQSTSDPTGGALRAPGPNPKAECAETGEFYNRNIALKNGTDQYFNSFGAGGGCCFKKK